MELQEEFEKTGLSILAITETKKKGIGSMELSNGHVFIYSGVPKTNRAAAGVGLIINKDIKHKIKKWDGNSERILKVEMKGQNGGKMTIIVAYGPNEDAKAEEKDMFWEKLTNATETCDGKIYVLGDFNARVGITDKEYETIIGRYGENVRNNNGLRMLDYCQLNNLIITNTFYQHKDIHKYTRAEPSRQEKSIIDYIVVQEGNKSSIIDVRVRRGPEIGSDHFLLVAKIKQETTNFDKERKLRDTTTEHETIRSYRLNNENIATKYRTEIKKEIEARINDSELSAKELWNHFKDIVIDTAKKVCGTFKTNKDKKQTAWWTDEIKKQVKIKKKSWKQYLATKTEENYKIYKEQRKHVKTLVNSAKREAWEEFGEKMEKDSKNNQKLFYKVLKNLRNEKQNVNLGIKNNKGEILTDNNKIMERWREYFCSLLNTDTDQNEHTSEETTETNPMDSREITHQELNEAIKKLKNGKAPGHDKITSEMIKQLGQTGKGLLLQLLNKTWEEESIPQDWEIGIILPIFKKGDNKECKNYRGITLLSTVLKVYEQILNNRLKEQIEHTLSEAQSGFRKGRSAQDHIFTLQQIIRKKKEKSKSVYLAFLDMEKAFDRVPRKKIWESLHRRGADGKLIKSIQSLYKRTQNYVISKNRKSELFTTQEGLRQGGGLSPSLFIVFMDEIIRECNQKVNKLNVGHRNLETIQISECVFADDVAIMTNTETHLQENIDIWNTILKKYSMKINKEKTKVMAVAENGRTIQIQIENDTLEQVRNFQYLGVIIDEEGKQDLEINRRIEQTVKCYYALNRNFLSRKQISKKTKINIYKSIYRPILTYGCETWIMTDRQKSKIQATEMKYLRRVKGVTRTDRNRNQDIRNELGVQSIFEFIDRRKLSWWGHMQRMGDTRTVKRVWQTKTDGKRRRGRPRLTWDGSVGKILADRGVSWNQAAVMARNKKDWCKFVYS